MSNLFPSHTRINNISFATKKDHESKLLECYQESFLLGLLNTFCSFSLQHLNKKSIKTPRTPRIHLLYISGETIDVTTITDTQCKLIFNKEISEGVPHKIALRRYNKNKKIFYQNFIYDICLEQGYYFNSKLSKQSNKSLQLERIDKTFLNGKFIFQKMISSIVVNLLLINCLILIGLILLCILKKIILFFIDSLETPPLL
ncbi:TATA-binding protein-associated phosphoprotein [Entamoeba marina]